MTASSLPRVLLSGVDSLYLFTHSPLRDEAVEQLTKAQGAAKLAAKSGTKPPVLLLGEHAFQVRPHGAQSAPLLLSSEHLDVTANPRPARGFPTLSAELRALFLWQLGVRDADTVAEAVAEEIAVPFRTQDDGEPDGPRVHFQISRIDVCADVQGWNPPEDPRAYTTRAEYADVHYVRKQFTGITFGRGGPIVARIYDKTKEITVSGKAWFRDLWATSADYDPGQPVWRLEFQLRREGLGGFRLDRSGRRLRKLDDICPATGQLWRLLCSRWLALRCRSAGDRQQLQPEWEAIRTGAFGDASWNACTENLYRIARAESGARCVAQLSGYLSRGLAGLAYRDGVPLDVDALTPELLEEVRRHTARRGTSIEERATEHVKTWRQQERAAFAGPPPFQGPPFRKYVADAASALVAAGAAGARTPAPDSERA